MDWRVPFVDFPEQWRRQREELLPVIETVISQGDLMLRQQLADFEGHLAAFVGTSRAVGVSNCTDGLRLVAHALDVGPADEIVTVAHTFAATISPFVLRGATPVLVDIGDDHLMDCDQLASVVSPRTKVILPVHLNGRTCDMDPVIKVAESVGATIVEDAAQALGATYRGRDAGTFGLASSYSFYPAKSLGALGDAGAVLTDDDALADRVRILRDHGRTTKSAIGEWGYNCRLDNVQAAILDWRLAQLPSWIDRRRTIAGAYQARLSQVPEVEIPPGPDEDPLRLDVFQNYVVTTDARDQLGRYLAGHGIETLISWPVPLHHQPGLGLEHWSLPQTERLCQRVLSLPMYPELGDHQVDYVCDHIARFFGA
jgi:dTDP-4-amino-4,6-dideoxygalactose transaminase